MCDDDRRPLNPIVIRDFDRTESSPLRQLLCDNLSGVLRDLRVPAVVVGIGKDAGLIDDLDRGWHQALLDSFDGADIEVIGSYVLTQERIIRLPDPLDLAAARLSVTPRWLPRDDARAIRAGGPGSRHAVLA